VQINFRENLSMAAASLKSNKLRSLLTMLGIIIGIAAVIAIETVGGSMSGSVTDSMSGMGVSNITVSLAQKNDSQTIMQNGVPLRIFMELQPDEEDLLTDEMIRDFMAAFPDQVERIELTRPVGNGTIPKINDAQTTITAIVQGTNSAALRAKEQATPILSGRWLDEERDAGRNVCVVSEKFVQQAIGGSNAEAVGKRFTININGTLHNFYIMGVYQYVQTEYYFGVTNEDDAIQTNIYLPLDVAAAINGDGGGYESVTVVAANGVDVTAFVDIAGSFFASYYTRNDTWTAQASSLSSLVESLTEMLGTVSLGISAIAAISLLVGGIGVMNIMTVSVTERTREIGTRKALGAPASAIRLQFITESILLCAIGGVIGVILGIALGSAASSLIGFAAKPSLQAIVTAVAFSMAIGIFFGYYPANKAAKMDPIEALRYE